MRNGLLVAGWKFLHHPPVRESPFMTHAHAPLTPTGPLRMVHRHLYDGVPQAHVAAKFRVSRPTVATWVARYRAEGEAGLRDLTPPGENLQRPPQRIRAGWAGHRIHLDVKKLGRIPDGGGWWALGRDSRQALASERARKQRGRYTYLPSAVDGFSRLACTEAFEDEKAATGNGANYAGVGLHPHRGSTGQQALTDPPLHATAQRQSRALSPVTGR